MDCVFIINYFVLVCMLSWVCMHIWRGEIVELRKIQSIERSSLSHPQIFPTLLQLYDIFYDHKQQIGCCKFSSQ